MYIAESVFKTELKFNQPEVVPVVNLQNSDFIVVFVTDLYKENQFHRGGIQQKTTKCSQSMSLTLFQRIFAFKTLIQCS